MSNSTHTREISLRDRLLNAAALAAVTAVPTVLLLLAEQWIFAALIAALGLAFIAITLRVKVVRTDAPEVIKAREEFQRREQARIAARESEIFSGIYYIGALVAWVVTFVGCWIYCIATYGFLLGVGLGWLPSGIVATVVAFLWPLLAIGAALLALYIWRAT